MLVRRDEIQRRHRDERVPRSDTGRGLGGDPAERSSGRSQSGVAPTRPCVRSSRPRPRAPRYQGPSEPSGDGTRYLPERRPTRPSPPCLGAPAICPRRAASRARRGSRDRRPRARVVRPPPRGRRTKPRRRRPRGARPGTFESSRSQHGSDQELIRHGSTSGAPRACPRVGLRRARSPSSPPGRRRRFYMARAPSWRTSIKHGRTYPRFDRARRRAAHFTSGTPARPSHTRLTCRRSPRSSRSRPRRSRQSNTPSRRARSSTVYPYKPGILQGRTRTYRSHCIGGESGNPR